MIDTLREAETVGFDSENIRAHIENVGMQVMIPRRRNSKRGNKGLDWLLYKYRHLVENALARFYQFRAVATRYDKPGRNYESAVTLACSFLWLPM